MTASVLVTGANSLIGIAVLRRLRELDIPAVATFHVNSSRLRALSTEAGGIEVVGPFDIRRQTSLQILQDMPQIRTGLSGIVNVASFSTPSAWDQDILECEAEVFSETFEVEVLGTLRLVQALREHLVRESSIVLFGSAAARSADMDTAVYNPAKEALASLAVHLAKRLAPYTRVNVVLPGAIATDWLTDWRVTEAEIAAFKASKRGLMRLGTPDEVASLVTFLLSPASGYISAQQISVDGGSQA